MNYGMERLFIQAIESSEYLTHILLMQQDAVLMKMVRDILK